MCRLTVKETVGEAYPDDASDEATWDQFVRCTPEDIMYWYCDFETLPPCKEILTNLPPKFQKPSYTVNQTLRLAPVPTHAHCSFLAVNIICVQFVTSECHPPRSFESLICESFDITLCSIALRVNPDLSFRFISFSNAAEALLKNRLILSTRSFAKGGKNIRSQLLRIAKYTRRGFSFPS